VAVPTVKLKYVLPVAPGQSLKSEYAPGELRKDWRLRQQKRKVLPRKKMPELFSGIT
jgi:hypothetical protein